MSLQNNSPSYLGNALIGACCAILLSVPTSACLASFLGDTYLVRVWVYSGFLLWVIAGAMTIFFGRIKVKKIIYQFASLPYGLSRFGFGLY